MRRRLVAFALAALGVGIAGCEATPKPDAGVASPTAAVASTTPKAGANAATKGPGDVMDSPPWFKK